MTSKSDWDDDWGGLSSGGKQEDNTAGKGQAEATGTDYFFGYQYLFAPAEAPREQHTMATKTSSELTGTTPIAEVRSISERSVTPRRRKGERRKGNRRGEREGKQEQKDTDIKKKRWYQSKNKEVQGQSPRNQPQNANELLEEKDRPQTDDKINWLQVQMPTRRQPLNADELLEKLKLQVQKERKEKKEKKQTKEQKQSKEEKQSKDIDGTRGHAPNDTARVTIQSATENDSNPTNGRDSAGDSSLPFLNYFWSIQPLEESSSLLVSKSAAFLEARDEGVLSEKSPLQKDDEAPLRVHRLKRWFSTTPKQGEFGSSLDLKTDKVGNNDTQGPRFENEDDPGREFSLKNYGSNVEAALEEEEYSKSRSCMSFRRNPMSFSRVLPKDPKMDQTGRNNGQDPRFKEEDVTGLSVEDESKNCMSFRRDPEAKGSTRCSTSEQDYGASLADALTEEEDFSKSRKCMSFRRNPEARGSGKNNGQGPRFGEEDTTSQSVEDAPEEDEDYSKSRNCMSFQRNPDGKESSRRSTSENDYGASVVDALEEEEDFSKSRNCMSFRRNPEARGSGSFSDPKMDQSGRNDRHGPQFEGDVPGSEFDQDKALAVDDVREEEYYSKSRNCMSFRKNPEARGGGIFPSRAFNESRREPTSSLVTLTGGIFSGRALDASRQDTLAIEEEEARRKDTQLVTVVRTNGRKGSQEEIVLHEPNKEQDDDEQLASQWRAPRVESRKRGEHERAARRNWLARHGTLDQDYGANVDDALGEEDYSGTRNCMSFRRNPSARGSGIFLGRLEESRRESTSRHDTLAIKEAEKEEQHVAARDVYHFQDVRVREQDQDVSRQELDCALPGKERRPSSLPATKPTLPAKERSLPAKARQTLPAKERSLPAKGRQPAPIWQSRSEQEERVQPQSPEGASLWRGQMWGLLSLSVDSLDAEESTQLPTRKPIRINRAASKKSPADVCSIRAASWDSYDDEECYSNSSVSSVFSLESMEAW
jgi:hypothetical protein